MPVLEQIVADNLTEFRKQKKWTQAELAEMLHYSDKSVSKWERGASLPDLKVMMRLAELFEVSLEDLTTENAARNRAHMSQSKSIFPFRIFQKALHAVKK